MQLRGAGVSTGGLPQLLPFPQYGGPGRDPRGGCEVRESPDRAYAGDTVGHSSNPLHRGRRCMGRSCKGNDQKRGDRKCRYGNAAGDGANSCPISCSYFVIQLEGEQEIQDPHNAGVSG